MYCVIVTTVLSMGIFEMLFKLLQNGCHTVYVLLEYLSFVI